MMEFPGSTLLFCNSSFSFTSLSTLFWNTTWLNFKLFYKDYETRYTTYINPAPMFAFGWCSCGRKPEETHLSDLVTTWPSHMSTLGIPGRSSERRVREHCARQTAIQQEYLISEGTILNNVLLHKIISYMK